METLRLGVIGLGRMGQRHCRVYSNLRHAQLAGVCDCQPEVAEQTGQQYGVPAFTTVEALLPAVDAVSIVTPTPAHFDQAMYCLDQGVHVLVEKPMTETLAQAEDLARAAEASGCAVHVGHIERFNPAYVELKHVLDTITVLAINVRRLSVSQNSNSDVDVIQDLMIHDLDLILDLVGRIPEGVQAEGLCAVNHGVDHAAVQLLYSGGPLVSLTASRVTEHKIRTIEVTGLEAYIESDLLNKSLAIHRSTIGEYLSHSQKGVKYRQESIVECIHIPSAEPLFLELQYFVDSILQGTEAVISAHAGLRALQLSEAVRRAVCNHLVHVDVAAVHAVHDLTPAAA